MLLPRLLRKRRSGAIPGRFAPTGARFTLTGVRSGVTSAAATNAKHFRTGESFAATAVTSKEISATGAAIIAIGVITSRMI